jgi:hypothetical protein
MSSELEKLADTVHMAEIELQQLLPDEEKGARVYSARSRHRAPGEAERGGG